MIHIRENNRPLPGYVFSSRREAFTILLQLERERPKSTFTLHQGVK